MNVVGLVLGWLLRILFGLLTLSMALMRNWLQAIPLLAATLIVLPPVRALIEQQTGVTLSLLAVGPAKATALVQGIPDSRVEVLDTGHLVGAE